MNDTQILIEFEKVDPSSHEFSESFRLLSEPLSRAYVPVESVFARKFPDCISQDKFLHSLQPFFSEGIDKVDWSLAEERIYGILKQFFGIDFAKSLSANQEIASSYSHYLAIARDSGSKAPLGALYCMMKNDEVRVPVLGVTPEAQARGIGKRLMDSIKEHLPEAKKIALSTRITNEKALKAYHAWGFVPSLNTMEYWANLEYHF